MSNFNSEEFVLDFIFMQPHTNKGNIRCRAILSPKNVKRLARVLQENIDEYEKKFGNLSDEQDFPELRLSYN